jgi:hypothetical protein
MDKVSKAFGVLLVGLGLTTAIHAFRPGIGGTVRNGTQPETVFSTSTPPEANPPQSALPQPPEFRHLPSPAEPVVVTINQSQAQHLRSQRSDAPPPRAVGSLAQQLQKELKRVGCYGGIVNGEWTQGTQMAARAFIDRVNAKLPVNRPDPILFALVEAYKDKVCGSPCPPGQLLSQDQCLPTAVLARSKAGAGAGNKRSTDPAPSAIASWTTTASAPVETAIAADGRTPLQGPTLGAAPSTAARPTAKVGAPLAARNSASSGLASPEQGGWAMSILKKNWGPY